PANPDIRYSVSNDYFRKRADATKAINATTQDADTWQAAASVSADVTSDNFKKWFGDSKAVDDNGNPLILYHGSNANFTVFSHEKSGGLFNLTPDKNSAVKYASYGGGGRQMLNDADKFILNITTGDVYTLNPDTKKWEYYGETSENNASFELIKKSDPPEGFNMPNQYDLTAGGDDTDFIAIPKQRSIMPVYANISNPLDLRSDHVSFNETDRRGSAAKRAEAYSVFRDMWNKRFKDAELPNADTNGIKLLFGQIFDSYRQDKDFYKFWTRTKPEFATRTFEKYIVPELKSRGYDGLIYNDDGHQTYAAFDSNQIKSVDNRNPTADPDIRYSVSNDYFRKRADATKAINATTQDADTWQAPPKTRRAVPIEATITADERAGEAALTAHKTLQQIIDEIDSRYEQQAEIATQQAREHLDRIIEQENAKHIEIPGVPVSETAEAEAAEARELTLPYVMADEDAKDNVKKVSAEENQSIALITEAEALLKPADPLQADMEAYKKAKKDYRATVQGNKTNPGMVTDADVLASAEQVSKARDNVLKKIEKREAAMKHALDNGTFAEVMLKQYEQLKQMKKAARNTKNPEAQAKAQKQAEQKQAYIFDINRRRKALLYKQAEETMGPLEAWTDKSIGLKYQRETFERNIRDIAPNKTIAERVNKEYRWVIDKNEAKRNKYRQDYNERVKALNMSDKVLPGNEVSERYAVQFVGEADYLIYISTAKKDRFAKTRADYQQDLNDFMAKNPNFNYEAIREKVKTMRGIYNAIYIDINKARVENGYEPVEYRKGYFPHFSEHKPDTLLSKLAATFGINTAPDSLPTSINGLTYQFRPGTRWFGNILRRSSNTTDYDAVKGFDRYILGASDVIFHTEDIQRLRAMSNYIREYGSDKRLQDQAKLIRADDTKTAE
ncbi:MAG: hypothetical protein M0P69_21635, partial [Bacteroidales bacterium]|nr:hypothetical protein [Bacteroidales bacterium]